MDGQHALWDTAAATFGEDPRVEILDLIHATGYRWEAVHLFQPSGSPLATKVMRVLVRALLEGMGTGVILHRPRNHPWFMPTTPSNPTPFGSASWLEPRARSRLVMPIVNIGVPHRLIATSTVYGVATWANQRSGGRVRIACTASRFNSPPFWVSIMSNLSLAASPRRAKVSRRL